MSFRGLSRPVAACYKLVLKIFLRVSPFIYMAFVKARKKIIGSLGQCRKIRKIRITKKRGGSRAVLRSIIPYGLSCVSFPIAFRNVLAPSTLGQFHFQNMYAGMASKIPHVLAHGNGGIFWKFLCASPSKCVCICSKNNLLSACSSLANRNAGISSAVFRLCAASMEGRNGCSIILGAECRRRECPRHGLLRFLTICGKRRPSPGAPLSRLSPPCVCFPCLALSARLL